MSRHVAGNSGRYIGRIVVLLGSVGIDMVLLGCMSRVDRNLTAVLALVLGRLVGVELMDAVLDTLSE